MLHSVSGHLRRPNIFFAFEQVQAEVRGHYSDNRRRLPIKRQNATDYVPVSAKPPLPDAMAEHHHLLFSGLILFRQERAAVKRVDAENLKEPFRNVGRV